MCHVRWIDEISAGESLPDAVHRYFRQGAGGGVTAAEATASWDRLRLRPRILRDVSTVSTEVTVLGHRLRTPVLIAPTTLQRQAHPDGETATAKASVRAGSLMQLSTNAGTRFADIGDQGTAWWIQAYLWRDRGLSLELLHRAKAAGATAIVLTADTPVVGNKPPGGDAIWDLIPDGHLLANVDTTGIPEEALAKADDLGFDDIGRLRDEVGLPVVVKGVLRGDDARDCVAAGATAVQVSNHGGRQLDLAVSTRHALPEVVDALAGTGAEVYVDGGIQRGEHILAALALGARAVFIGRPVLWALAAGGEPAVTRLLTELTRELRHAMALAGAPTIADLSADLVWPGEI